MYSAVSGVRETTPYGLFVDMNSTVSSHNTILYTCTVVVSNNNVMQIT